jgi:uncharacterized protein
MSQENIETVRAGFEAWNAGDMDAVRELYDPDVIMRAPEGWPEPGPFIGREAVMHQFEQLRETWDADTAEPVSDFIDAADHVVVRMIWRGAGRGPESSMEWTIIFTVRNSRIFGVEYFWDHAQALDAVELPEGATSQENLELARRSMDAINRRDLAAYLALAADDIEAISRLAPIEGGYHGHDGIRRWWGTLFDTWPDFTIEVVEMRTVGDLTLGTLHLRGHGASSDIPSDWTVCSVGRWRRGKCVWWGNFRTRGEALEAVGLVAAD